MVAILAKKQEKIRKKFISKRNNLKKGKNGGSKTRNQRFILQLKIHRPMKFID